MTYEEALSVVFPLLNGRDLVSCMRVCKQWRDIAGDDYFWKCLCAKHWPSICKRFTPPTLSYRKLFHLLCKHILRSTFRREKFQFSFYDLELYVDIKNEDGRLLFFEIIPGSDFPCRINDLLPGVYERLSDYLDSPEYKFIIPIEPTFSIMLGSTDTLSLSIHLVRTDTYKAVCICENFDLDPFEYQCLLPNPLGFPPNIVPRDILNISVSVTALYVEDADFPFDVDVSGIALELGDSGLGIELKDENELLSALHMLDWK